ncbi:hypothetical protein D9615_003464 [Tricholomella constricta]|uniref:Uncharacterized protein n=1 Tax=Tricholomella constricta TaxID=117010 RepID=A0A8H5HJ64_9AGAR|nr:hypothetical protein D9615_003464 [Tricholomella constricta]
MASPTTASSLDDFLQTPPLPPRSLSPSNEGHHDQPAGHDSNDSFNSLDGDNEDSDELGLSVSTFSTPSVVTHRKRASEDWSQYADSVARRIRLKQSNAEELKDFAKMTGPQQSILLAAMVMRSQEIIQLVQPAEAVYQIPTSLDAKIEKYVFVIFLEPSLGAYVTEDYPIKQLTDFLQRFPGWGLTNDIMEDPSKLKVIVAKARDCFVTLRNLVKTKIEESIGTKGENGTYSNSTDVGTLCHQIVALRSRIAPKVKPSVKMCGRVAFLRSTFINMMSLAGKVDRTYWPKVDKELEKIRVNKGNDTQKISDVFSRMLTADRLLHGRGDIESLVAQAVTAENNLDSQEQSEATSLN